MRNFYNFPIKNARNMKMINKTISLLAISLASVIPMKAQNKFEVSGGMDLVSNYIWRGMNQESGVSLQPVLNFAYKGFNLEAWGNGSLSEMEPQELDIILGYCIGGFDFSVTDYWWNGANAPYGHYKKSHYFEGTICYYFGEKCPLTLSWNTMFAGGDKDAEGHRYYSSYFSASYNITLPKEITLTPAIGFNPYESQYDKNFNVMEVSLKAAKNLKITNHFTIPLYVQAIVSPACDHAYLLAGFHIGF